MRKQKTRHSPVPIAMNFGEIRERTSEYRLYVNVSTDLNVSPRSIALERRSAFCPGVSENDNRDRWVSRVVGKAELSIPGGLGF